MRAREHPVVASIRPEIERTLADFGYELVQLKFGGRGSNPTLTVMIDKPGGVTSEDCRYMARRLSLLLDMLDPIPSRYQLVVSSPGVDRPLTRDADFERYAGQQVSVRYYDEDDKRHTVAGRLTGVEGDRAVIETTGGRVEVPLAGVESANIVYEWEERAEQ